MTIRIYGIVLTWALIAGWGSYVALRYETTPGARGAAPARWPADVPLARGDDKPTLVMFAHPCCPCTRASMHELSLLLDRNRDQVEPYVVFLRPEGTSEEWSATDLVDQAEAISGLHVVVDHGGRISNLFDVKTSGETLLYSVDGRLVFHGGITASRGHQGDNLGHAALQSLLRHTPMSQSTQPAPQTCIYGCPLKSLANETSKTSINHDLDKS